MLAVTMTVSNRSFFSSLAFMPPPFVLPPDSTIHVLGLRLPEGDHARAFSSEVDTGSREENASKQEIRASVLIQSEPILL
jgi:hypothetical protein